MASTADNDPARLESDFLSGRNPLAYIPLCHALRRQKKFARALEVCQKGLTVDSGSVAGRVLLALLFSDLGRYREACEEMERLEPRAPDAMGLLVEKTRALLHLRRFDEAERTLKALDARNPMDPQVQMLHTTMRQFRNQMAMKDGGPRSGVVPRLVRLTTRQMLDAIIAEMKNVVEILGAAVIPLRAGDPAVEGDPATGECAYEFFRESTVACGELDCGGLRSGFLETDKAQLIVLVRREHLVSFCTRPMANFGKVLYRLQMVVSRMMPEADGRGAADDTRPDENETLAED